MKKFINRIVSVTFDHDAFEEALKEVIADSIDYTGIAEMFLETYADEIRDAAYETAEEFAPF